MGVRYLYFVFDVDGTICFNGQFIEEEIVKALEYINDKHSLIFASARPIRDLIPVVPMFKENVLIGGNGSIISEQGNIQVIEYISDKEYIYIKSLIEDYKLSYIIDGSFDYSAKVEKKNLIYRQLDPMKLAKNVSMSEIEKPIKIILVDISEEIYEEISNKITKNCDDVTINFHRSELNIDITAKGINKYTTLKKIIGDSEYIGYGNDINDHDLLKNACKSYYISKSDSEVDLDFGITEVLSREKDTIVSSIKSHGIEKGDISYES